MTRGTDLVRAIELEVGFGPRTVLAIEALRIAAGRVTVLLGPGGSGKSTLLALLAGRRSPCEEFWQRGQLFVAELSRVLVVQRVPHHPLAGLAPLLDGGQLARVWPQAPEIVALLEAALWQPAAALPRAVERLAAVTAGLLIEPRVLLLDEPEVELSATEEQHLAERIRCYPGTVVCATHNLRFARAIADEAMLLVHGRLIEQAPADPFFLRPQHPRTRQYLHLGG